MKTDIPFFEVLLEADLEEIKVAPPAIAYVRKVGDFFLRHSYPYWLGQKGDPDRWVRLPYCGNNITFKATDISELSLKALRAVADLIYKGPEEWDNTLLQDIGGGLGDYYQTAFELCYAVWNPLLLELNTKTCQDIDQGPQLYEINSGDIVYDTRGMFCAQEATKEGYKSFGYDVHKIGIQPLKEGTPGIHIQRAEEKQGITATHPERIGFIITEAASKGDTSIKCKVIPDSLMETKINANGKVMIDTDDGSSGRPGSRSGIPTINDQPNKPWGFTNHMWLTGPWESVNVPVTGYSDIAGGEWPQGLSATLTLGEPYPIPCLGYGVCVNTTEDWRYLPDHYPSFGWSLQPGSLYGGFMGATELPIRANYDGHEQVEGYNNYAPTKGSTKIDLWNPSVSLPVGQRYHSGLRGTRVGDFVVFESHRTIYRIIEISETRTQNPNWIKIDPPLQEDLDASEMRNARGYWIGENCYRFSANVENLELFIFGWLDPDDNRGIPIFVKNVNYDNLNLMAPLPADIQEGTRLPIWSGKDNYTATYAYYDPHVFVGKLRLWNRIKELDRKVIWNKILQLKKRRDKLNAHFSWATDKAAHYWYSPPYYVNKDVNEWFDWPHGGDSFAEAFALISEQDKALRALLDIRAPSVKQVEYISMLDYNHSPLEA